MKTTVRELRRVIREEVELNEIFGLGGKDFSSTLDDILQDLSNTNKKVEKAHEMAPAGAAKAIVAGLHSDLFNKVAEFRKYIKQLKQMASGKVPATESRVRSTTTTHRHRWRNPRS
jgi:sugar (pentulose or hexulose) kinase